MSNVTVDSISPRTTANVDITGLGPPTYLGDPLAILADVVAKDGSTMNGPLVLSGNATNNLEAVPKQQVVMKAGDTMTGPLVLSGNASASLHPVAYQQVSATLNNHSKVANGWCTLPSGVILQWGMAGITPGSNSTSTTITFPVAFTTALFLIVGNADKSANPGWNPVNIIFDTRTLSSVRAVSDTGNNAITFQSGININWFALGV